MAEMKRSAPADRHQPTKPTREQHGGGAAGDRREQEQKADLPAGTADSIGVRQRTKDRSG